MIPRRPAIVDRPSTIDHRPLFILLAILAGLPACSEEFGPTPPPTATVRGRVHIGGSPIRAGWVEFYPVDGAVGNLRSAPLRPDGTFEVTRVALGPNLIRLAHPGPQPPTPYLDPRAFRLFQRTFSPIRRTFSDPVESIDLDLREEARDPAAARALGLGG